MSDRPLTLKRQTGTALDLVSAGAILVVLRMMLDPSRYGDWMRPA
jgi:hypothetical protein